MIPKGSPWSSSSSRPHEAGGSVELHVPVGADAGGVDEGQERRGDRIMAELLLGGVGVALRSPEVDDDPGAVSAAGGGPAQQTGLLVGEVGLAPVVGGDEGGLVGVRRQSEGPDLDHRLVRLTRSTGGPTPLNSVAGSSRLRPSCSCWSA